MLKSKSFYISLLNFLTGKKRRRKNEKNLERGRDKRKEKHHNFVSCSSTIQLIKSLHKNFQHNFFTVIPFKKKKKKSIHIKNKKKQTLTHQSLTHHTK